MMDDIPPTPSDYSDIDTTAHGDSPAPRALVNASDPLNWLFAYIQALEARCSQEDIDSAVAEVNKKG